MLAGPPPRSSMPPFPPHARRSRASAVVFGGWAAAALSLVVWLGAQHPHLPLDGKPDDVAVALAAGWRAVHHLDLREASAAAVIHHLAATPPPERQGQGVILVGSDQPLEQRLAQAGWTFTRTPESRLETGSSLQVYAPTGERQWSGRYDTRALEEPGAALLSQSLLAALARGENLPPTVPVGCRPLPPPAP